MKRVMLMVLMALTVLGICSLAGSALADPAAVNAAIGSASFTSLKLGQAVTPALSKAGDIAWYSFTPSQTGYYIFSSSGHRHVRGYLYNASKIQLKNAAYNGASIDFSIGWQLKAGVTYYYAAEQINDESSGDISLMLEKGVTGEPAGRTSSGAWTARAR